jgi:DNA-binding NarL/FixJ family response regulator
MENEVHILIADDHPIFRRGLRTVIEAEAGMNVVADAENGDRAFASICEHEPDIAILDLNMPGRNGFEVTRAIQERGLAVAVIILTMHNAESMFNAALDLGVMGYVLKDSAMPEIIDCIKSVIDGRHYISPQLSTYLIDRGNRSTAFTRQTPTLKVLTPAEQHILKLIADEKTSRQIADKLNISTRTVDRHRANICVKLNLRGSNALIKFALVHKSEL